MECLAKLNGSFNLLGLPLSNPSFPLKNPLFASMASAEMYIAATVIKTYDVRCTSASVGLKLSLDQIRVVLL